MFLLLCAITLLNQLCRQNEENLCSKPTFYWFWFHRWTNLSRLLHVYYRSPKITITWSTRVFSMGVSGRGLSYERPLPTGRSTCGKLWRRKSHLFELTVLYLLRCCLGGPFFEDMAVLIVCSDLKFIRIRMSEEEGNKKYHTGHCIYLKWFKYHRHVYKKRKQIRFVTV